MESLTIESEPHLHPDELRGALQAMIDDITADTETIIFANAFYSHRDYRSQDLPITL